MSLFPPEYHRLAEALDRFSGIGPLAARRMVQQVLLQSDLACDLALAVNKARSLGLCPGCRCFMRRPEPDSDTDAHLCEYCADPERNHAHMLVVEHTDSAQVWLDRGYRGRFWILHRLLSPIDRVGPSDVGVNDLMAHVTALVQEQPGLHVFLALPDSVEGRATELFFNRLVTGLGVPCLVADPESLLLS